MVSAGPARVTQVLREALARGADRAIHVQGDHFATADAFTAAEALAGALGPEQPDLILTGLQSDDQGFAQVGVVLAEKLGVAHSTIIMEVQVDGHVPARQARARRRLVSVDRDAAAGGADDSERHQPASLRHAERHHGGQEEGNPRGGRAGRRRARASASCPSTCRRSPSRRG